MGHKFAMKYDLVPAPHRLVHVLVTCALHAWTGVMYTLTAVLFVVIGGGGGGGGGGGVGAFVVVVVVFFIYLS